MISGLLKKQLCCSEKRRGPHTHLTVLISKQSMNPSAVFSPCDISIVRALHGTGERTSSRGRYLLVKIEYLGTVLLEPSLLVAAHEALLAPLLEVPVQLHQHTGA